MYSIFFVDRISRCITIRHNVYKRNQSTRCPPTENLKRSRRYAKRRKSVRGAPIVHPYGIRFSRGKNANVCSVSAYIAGSNVEQRESARYASITIHLDRTIDLFAVPRSRHGVSKSPSLWSWGKMKSFERTYLPRIGYASNKRAPFRQTTSIAQCHSPFLIYMLNGRSTLK